MTLEDFFTLTEMQDGLTSAARVKELVTVMQKETDSVVKNVGDATRQWSSVASTIAATEDKECLDLFIQLDGLWFIDRWLKDAQKFVVDASDSFVEDSITVLLQAIEKLHMNNEKSVSSGIWMTVKSLFSHTSSRIQDRARALFDIWKQDRDGDMVPQDIEKGGAVASGGKDGSVCTTGESGHLESLLGGTSFLEASSNEERHVEPARDDIIASTSSDTLKHETVDDIHISSSDRALDIAITKDGPLNSVSSSVRLKYVKESLPIEKDLMRYHSEDTTSCETSSVSPEQGTVKGKVDVPGLSGYINDAKHMARSYPENAVSTQLDNRPLSSSADEARASKPVAEPGLQKNSDPKYEHPGLKSSVLDNADIDVSEKKCNIEFPNHCKSTPEFRISAQGGEGNADVFLDSSGKESKDRETCSLRVEDIGADGVKENVSDEDEDSLENDSDFYKQVRDSRAPDLTDKRTDIDLDYGIVDPLEVALKVAMEVEREVIHGSEPSCSSSDKIPDGNQQPDSPESIDGKQSQPIDRSAKESPTGSDMSTEASPDGKETIITSGNLDVEPMNSLQNKNSSYVSEAAQEPEGITDKGVCDFDLNQDFCSEETDRTVNPISSFISVVSASRATAAPGLPVAPLQFEGTLGWKGSAVTSAFRPASPRRIPEGDKVLLSGGSHCSLKQNNCLDIDLNVAESEDDKVSDLKQIPASFGLPSGELSVEASPRRSDRLNLDLNRVTDDGDVRSDWTMERQLIHHKNNHHNHPLLSSSFLQPSVRNIDLNDQPSFVNDSADHPNFGKSSPNLSASGQLKSDESVVTIMGMRVEVNRKDIPQTLSSPNGRIPEPVMDVNLARTGAVLGLGSSLMYAHSPIYGYNGLTSGPTVPFSSTQYGPGGFIPYMVDSRGAPVVPQIVGSGSAISHTFSRMPFIMTGMPSSNGAGPSRHTLDLNSGFMIDDGGRDAGGLRQLFNPGLSSSVGEHLANSQQSSSSVIGGKRNEPDSGWESCPLNYKHHQPQWK